MHSLDPYVSRHTQEHVKSVTNTGNETVQQSIGGCLCSIMLFYQESISHTTTTHVSMDAIAS